MSEKWYERLDRLAGKAEGGGRDEYLREHVELAHKLKCPVRVEGDAKAGSSKRSGKNLRTDEVIKYPWPVKLSDNHHVIQLTPKRADYLIGGGRSYGKSQSRAECGYTYYPALQEEENALQPADQAGRGD